MSTPGKLGGKYVRRAGSTLWLFPSTLENILATFERQVAIRKKLVNEMIYL
jgi:hypothetical protein